LIQRKLDQEFTKKNTNSFLVKLYFFILGRNYFNTMNTDSSNLAFMEFNKDKELFNDLTLDRFFAYFLFNETSNAVYFYEGVDNILSTLKFKHSINLEYVFGLFPTVIIGFIIVPSMYLLYSNETDINPCITIKVIGHQ
jgi:hypothetical protein